MQYEFGIVPKSSTLTKKRYKIIFSPAVARHLLKKGDRVVDIKPDRNNSLRTLFIFKVDEKFNRDLASLMVSTAE